MFRLEQNLKRLNYKAIIRNKDIRNFSTQKTWSKIILDAPCSSTGTLRKNPEIMHQKKESDIVSYQNFNLICLICLGFIKRRWHTYILYLFSRKRRRRKSNRKFHKKKKNSLLDEINTSEIDKKLNVSNKING
ncbi:MAG: hypothetical protein CM15mP109_03790 [Candidatus Dadabacteria bacterium]|nr:MAG: hypothetical protein CM15mP109_03790 [Candidatus Dadabacteria bacterium]